MSDDDEYHIVPFPNCGSLNRQHSYPVLEACIDNSSYPTVKILSTHNFLVVVTVCFKVKAINPSYSTCIDCCINVRGLSNTFWLFWHYLCWCCFLLGLRMFYCTCSGMCSDVAGGNLMFWPSIRASKMNNFNYEKTTSQARVQALTFFKKLCSLFCFLNTYTSFLCCINSQLFGKKSHEVFRSILATISYLKLHCMRDWPKSLTCHQNLT